MSTYRAALGARGEDIALAFLQAHGYTIQARNYRCRYGEIDLVCAHGAVLVFCAVKLRRSTGFGWISHRWLPFRMIFPIFRKSIVQCFSRASARGSATSSIRRPT